MDKILSLVVAVCVLSILYCAVKSYLFIKEIRDCAVDVNKKGADDVEKEDDADGNVENDNNN